METTRVTLQLPKADMSFLEDYTKRHKTTITQLFDSYVRQLQQTEQHMDSRSVDDELAQHTGIIPADIHVEREYYQALEEKHQ